MEIRVGDWIEFVDAESGRPVSRAAFVGEMYPSGLIVTFGLWPYRREAQPNAAFTADEIAALGWRVEVIRHANRKEWELARLNGIDLPESGGA